MGGGIGTGVGGKPGTPSCAQLQSARGGIMGGGVGTGREGEAPETPSRAQLQSALEDLCRGGAHHHLQRRYGVSCPVVRAGRLACYIVFRLEGIPFDVFCPKLLGEEGGHFSFIQGETGVEMVTEHLEEEGCMGIDFSADDEDSMDQAVEWCEDLIDTTFDELDGWSAQPRGGGGGGPAR